MSTRGPERTPAPGQGIPRTDTSGRPPAVQRGPLRDTRDDVRDTTRTKTRRKATAAQRAAREAKKASHDKGGATVQRPSTTPEQRNSPSKLSVPRAERRAQLKQPLPQIGRTNRNSSRPTQLRDTPAKTRTTRHIPPTRELPKLPQRLIERLPDPDHRQVHRHNGHEVTLTDAQARVITDVARFRIARTEAVQHYVYGAAAQRDPNDPYAHKFLPQQRQIDALRERGFVEQIHSYQGGPRYLTLTKEGAALAKSINPQSDQRYYASAKKPAERVHDAAIYEAYQHAAAKLESQGHKPTIVRLDYQLKSEVRSEAYASAKEQLASAGTNIKELPQADQQKAIAAASAPVATTHDLPVSDDGSVDYPDLQIEYERPDGAVGRCNVEIVTDNYKSADVASKEAGGFELYLPAVSDSGRGGTPKGVTSLAEQILDF